MSCSFYLYFNKYKDSSEFNEKCCYNKDNPTKDNSSVAKLENSTIDDLDTFLKDESGDYKSYSIFTESLIGADDFGLTERKSVWDRLAFANYVQYFVPTIDTPRQTKTDLRNFDALLKTIRVLKPDIIVIWGTKVTDHFQEDYFKRYFQSKVKLLELQKNDYYWKLEYLGHKIVIVNPYHPSSRIWNSNVARFIRAFKCALETPYDEISNIQPFPKKEC